MYKTTRGSQEVYIHPSSVLFRLVSTTDLILNYQELVFSWLNFFSKNTTPLFSCFRFFLEKKLRGQKLKIEVDMKNFETGKHHLIIFAKLLLVVCFRVNPKWVVYHSLVSTDRQYMRNVITIDPGWLTEAAPHFYQYRQLSHMPH